MPADAAVPPARRPRARACSAAAALALAAGLGAGAAAPAAAGPPPEVRFATFNASLNRAAPGELTEDLATPGDPQAAAVAEIVQRVRPEVLLVNEFDYVPPADPGDPTSSPPVAGFLENYLGVSQDGADPIDYPYAFIAPSNTGVPSGFDLNDNGSVGGPDDALGFGFFPGQFGMLVLSQHPIDTDAVRTFQDFRWADMPGARLPDDPATPEPADWYSPEELAVLPLSSKSHWDVPVLVDGRTPVHVLASHPTPPVFDGPEDRNGLRNADEIRFWADYVLPSRSRYVYDDDGGRGGLEPGDAFVIMGDLNSDPFDGDSLPGAAQQVLESPRVNARTVPDSDGAVEATALQGGANLTHEGDPAHDTADFADGTPGNLRVDYVLPSKSLRVTDSGVFWPVQADPLSRLTGTFPFPSSDHRLVWVDVRVPPAR
ncbi:endonuclease/exonuclease/phosphatase family protein [Aquipuribacter nitratireducens]|uniref:Endonuclease/exonuclease/phosphatase family protein n=1 Tax=Aquipuribacter nitratireducens TaxID=650104 RepID=A0ABW0GK02_9MICO